jgi:SAM-dependent methyltransferase
MRGASLKDWVTFWDSDHSIYVNAHHLDVHYRKIAEDIVSLLPSSSARVLDHGCGEALHADKIAAKCGGLFLCEAAPTVRARIAKRFEDEPKIRAIGPAEVERLPFDSLDFIVANSLVQFLKQNELERLLATWRRILKPGGKLVIADVIWAQRSIITDAAALLRFAASNGFLIAAFLGLVRTFFSDYRKLRAQLGITYYTSDGMIQKLERAGFSAKRLPNNLGHNQQRMAFEALRPA